MKINKKILIIAIATTLIVGGAAAFFIFKNLQPNKISKDTSSQSQGVNRNDAEAARSSLTFTMSSEALAAVHGVLKVTVALETSETVDRIEYSSNDALKATSKEHPYGVDIDVSAFALGKYTLKGVAIATSGAVIAEQKVEFTIVTAAQAAKPPTPGGSSNTGGGNSTGGGAATPGGSTGGTLAGWQLTSTNTGLAPHGLSCGSLPLYTGGGKPVAGTFISGKRIATTLDLSAGGITIEKSCIQPPSVGQGFPLTTTTDYNNCPSDCALAPTTVTIRDSEFDGSLIDTNSVGGACALMGIATMERNYIHDTGSGICMFNTGHTLDVTIAGNYVHRLRAFGDPAGSGSHNEAFTIRDFPTDSNPNRRMKITNNRLDSSSGNDTGAAFIQTYGGDINQVVFEGNLFEGFGYQLILSAGFGNVYGTAMSAVNNRFSGTGYGTGYVDRHGLSYGWGEWKENYINNPSASSNKGSVVVEP